jgi:cutinase
MAVSSAAASMLLSATLQPAGALPIAGAASCPDVEVIFARGRIEPPGPGIIGDTFTDDLRAKVNNNIDLYAVNYPADTEADLGANDIGQRIRYNLANCPKTRLVLGGYSLGAAATDIAMAVTIPVLGFKTPLPSGAPSHIAAIALFGNGTQWLGPISAFNPAFKDRTIELCHGSDPICNPADPNTWVGNWPDHLAAAYIDSGLVDQAASFVAGKL